MKNFFTLILFITATSFLAAQTTTGFSAGEGYANGLLSNNTNWGGQFFYVNTTNESVATQSNTAEAFWGQSQPISEGETITFEVDMSFGGDLGVGVGVGDLYLLEGGIRIGDFGYKTSCASTSIIVSCIILPALLS